MTAPAPELTIEFHGADDLDRLLDELLAVYAEVYADRLGDPFSSLPRYSERLADYASRDGFSLVTGRVHSELIDYTLGMTLPAGSRWWEGFRGAADPDLFREDGHRTFAIAELMVRPAWRRQGHARALHDALLADRTEERATLLVRPDNAAARSAYFSWGWRKVGELQPFPDAPMFESLMLDLSSRTAAPPP